MLNNTILKLYLNLNTGLFYSYMKKYISDIFIIHQIHSVMDNFCIATLKGLVNNPKFP